MNLLIRWFISALAIIITAYLLPGVMLSGFIAALWVALILGILNALVKPIFFLLTLPITIITLGLFTFVLNAFMVWLASELSIGFSVKNFGWALLFSIILSIVTTILQRIFEPRQAISQ